MAERMMLVVTPYVWRETDGQTDRQTEGQTDYCTDSEDFKISLWIQREVMNFYKVPDRHTDMLL